MVFEALGVAVESSSLHITLRVPRLVRSSSLLANESLHFFGRLFPLSWEGAHPASISEWDKVLSIRSPRADSEPLSNEQCGSEQVLPT